MCHAMSRLCLQRELSLERCSCRTVGCHRRFASDLVREECLIAIIQYPAIVHLRPGNDHSSAPPSGEIPHVGRVALPTAADGARFYRVSSGRPSSVRRSTFARRRALSASLFLCRFSCSEWIINWACCLLVSKQPFADGPLARRLPPVFTMIFILRYRLDRFQGSS